MPSFKTDASSAVVSAATAPRPKLVGEQTGEIAVHPETYAQLATADLLPYDKGEGRLHQVTVLSMGIPENPSHYPLYDIPRCSKHGEMPVVSFLLVS